jgi:hypothetical protein
LPALADRRDGAVGLDVRRPARSRTIVFDEHGGGEFRFGAVVGGLDCGYGDGTVDFDWTGHDEMEEAFGDGWAELQDDGTIKGEIAFHRGDTCSFRAVRLSSSTAC